MNVMNVLLIAVLVCKLSVIFTDKIVEHWSQSTPTSVDSGMLTAADTGMSTSADTDDIVSDVDMTELRSENERKLASMSDTEILAKQPELLSTLGSNNNKW